MVFVRPISDAEGRELQRLARSLSFPVVIGAGEADAMLGFSKAGTPTLQFLNASGSAVGVQRVARLTAVARWAGDTL
jgi:hypothetical protein